MHTLPERSCSLLVRTDFASDDAWQQVADEATREDEDGFPAYAESASDPAFDRASRETVKAAVPVNGHGAMVLFIAWKAGAGWLIGTAAIRVVAGPCLPGAGP
jgi:hypothetical protein